MGCSCLVPNQSASREELPPSALKYVDYYEKPHKKDSINSVNTNPE